MSIKLNHVFLLSILLLPGCDDSAGDPPEPDFRIRRLRRDMRMSPKDAFVAMGDVQVSDVAPLPDPDDGVLPADMGLDPDMHVAADDMHVPDPDMHVPDPDMHVPDPDMHVEGPSPDCLQALASFRYDFEAGAQGFEHGTSDGQNINWPFDSWEQGQARSGPNACAEGQGCWGTDLGANYIQCQRAELISPFIDLRACAEHELLMVYEDWHDFWAEGNWADGGMVEASPEGGNWSALAPHRFADRIQINPALGIGYSCVNSDEFHVDGQAGVTGRRGGWQTVRLPLDGLHHDRFKIRFAYASGVSSRTGDPNESRRGTRPGWFLDNIRFEIR